MDVKIWLQIDSRDNPTVLYVEDNVDLNLAVREILEPHGFRHLSALNGKEALEILEQEVPDVVLCDIMMPKMNGYELLKRVRANPHLRSLPIIFLTARISQSDHREAMAVGIDHYLTKPADEPGLIIATRGGLHSKNADQTDQDQLDTLRQEIVGTLAHETRVPLTFVLGYAQYLENILDSDIALDELRIAIKGV